MNLCHAPFRVALAALIFAATCRAADKPAWHDDVANAVLIALVEPVKNDTSGGGELVEVKEVLKGVHFPHTLALPSRSLKPGHTALVLVPFKPPVDVEPAIQFTRNFQPPLRIWPVDEKGRVKPESGAEVSLDDVRKSIAELSPEEAGLDALVADALHSPEKFAQFAKAQPERAKYVEFVIALRTEGNRTPGQRWPQPVPADLKTPPDAFPKELVSTLEKKDAAAFAKAFAAWLDTGVMRDRQFKTAEALDEKIAAKCNVTALKDKAGYLSPAPRLPQEILFDEKIPANERMKLVAQIAQFWNYDRFVAERAGAARLVQSAPADSENVRRAAFWELHNADVPLTPGTLALRKLAGDSSPQAAAILTAAYFEEPDQEVMGAARMAIQAKNPKFIAALLERIKTTRSKDTARAARQLCQEGVIEVQPIMLEWLKDKDHDIREGAALTLCWSPRKENVPALLDALSPEKNNDVKSLLLVALAQIADAQTLDVLEAAARDKTIKPWAAFEIYRGLARNGSPRVLPALAQAAVAPEVPGGDEEDRAKFQAEAVNSFGWVSKLYPAHKPDDLWQESGFNPARVAENLAVIKKWQHDQPQPPKK